MDPKLLSQLWEVVLQGSLSRAAKTLHVTQPTLTRNMKALEEAVNAPVLRRGRHGVTPTKLGERLSEQGRIIDTAMSMAEETVQHWRTGLVGEVRLGIGAMVSASITPGFFAANPMKDANFTVHVVAGTPVNLMQRLRNHEIDMAIIPLYSTLVMDNVVHDVLFTDELCVVAGSRSPLTKLQGKINPQILKTQSWISINNMARLRDGHDHAITMLGIENIVPRYRFDGELTAPIALLRDSDMLALMSRRLAHKFASPDGIKILDVDVEFAKRDVVFLVNKKNDGDKNETDSIAIDLANMIKTYFSDNEVFPEPNESTNRDEHTVDST